LLGDWDGARLRLRDVGVDFQFGYVGEAAGNATGGLHREVAYADQWAAGITLDLGRLGVVEGGTVRVTYSDRNGRNLSDDADLGTFQEVEEIYGRGRTTRLTRFWYNQKFADGLVQWRIGRMPFSYRRKNAARPCRRGDRMMMLFAAVHESVVGTFETSRRAQKMSVPRGRPEVAFRCSHFRVWTQAV
jgi:carbohydrate-selective porin OprB